MRRGVRDPIERPTCPSLRRTRLRNEDDGATRGGCACYAMSPSTQQSPVGLYLAGSGSVMRREIRESGLAGRMC